MKAVLTLVAAYVVFVGYFGAGALVQAKAVTDQTHAAIAINMK